MLEQRAALEVGALVAAAPWLRRAGRGDRHPVLVLPGFTTGDIATAMLRQHLRSLGYWVHGWRLGLNLGPTPAVLAGIRERLDAVHLRHRRPVTLVGWSLGGIYARRLARETPEQVRSVITLASPYRMNLSDRSSLSGLVDRLAAGFDPAVLADVAVSESERPPLAVPSTSIYSRTDGVVHWSSCIDGPAPADGPGRENIEVRSSHSGMVVHPAVLYAVADRLRQPEDRWRPFHAPPVLSRWYPAAATWEPPPALT